MNFDNDLLDAQVKELSPGVREKPRTRKTLVAFLEKGRRYFVGGLITAGLLKTLVERLRRKPLALLSVIATLFVVLANAKPAMDGAEKLWLDWTQKYPPLETIWQGSWKGRNGFNFALALRLNVLGDNSAQGQIRWELVAAPMDSRLASRVGAHATEFVSGRYDREKAIATLKGYRVSDPTLLALDTYKFQILSDKVSFVGMSRYRGEWQAEASGKVILTEKR